MHFSLRIHGPLHVTPEVLWRWMLLAFGIIVFGLLCYIMLLAAGGQGSSNVVSLAVLAGPS
jgi:hypothetical protein